MNKDKKNELRYNVEILLQDWDILKDVDIGFRINSIQSKWHKANMNQSKLRKLMSNMGRLGGRPRKVILKNLADATLKD